MQTTPEARDHEMTAADDDRVLNLTRRFDAPPQAVFEAFTDPDQLVRWWGPEGMDVPEFSIDLRVGGTWRTCMRSASGELHCVRGIYKAIEPPRRLVMTWAWEGGEYADMETLVSFEFRESNGGTELHLRHEQFDSREQRDRHNMGWSSSMNCLAAYLAEAGGAA